MSTTPHGAQISVRFTLQSAVFKLDSILVIAIMAQVAPPLWPMSKMVNVDMLIDVYYTPQGPNFRPFRSTVSGLGDTGNLNFSIIN